MLVEVSRDSDPMKGSLWLCNAIKTYSTSIICILPLHTAIVKRASSMCHPQRGFDFTDSGIWLLFLSCVKN